MYCLTIPKMRPPYLYSWQMLKKTQYRLLYFNQITVYIFYVITVLLVMKNAAKFNSKLPFVQGSL